MSHIVVMFFKKNLPRSQTKLKEPGVIVKNKHFLHFKFVHLLLYIYFLKIKGVFTVPFFLSYLISLCAGV